MSTKNHYLAVFLGSKTSARSSAWAALSQSERSSREQQGIAAWQAWVQKHQGVISELGGPLGKTKRVGPEGITDIANNMGAFAVVQAESHEAAARLFENHPHFTHFPGDYVEVMPVMPVPGR